MKIFRNAPEKPIRHAMFSVLAAVLLVACPRQHDHEHDASDDSGAHASDTSDAGRSFDMDASPALDAAHDAEAPGQGSASDAGDAGSLNDAGPDAASDATRDAAMDAAMGPRDAAARDAQPPVDATLDASDSGRSPVACPEGYAEDGGDCEDIDECAMNHGGCDSLVRCTNTAGGRSCGPCPAFYRGSGDTGCVPLWTEQIGSTVDDEVAGIATDSTGSVYVAGTTFGDFDGYVDTSTMDMVLVKYDRAGTKRWTRELTPTLRDEAAAVTVDLHDNIYVVGSTLGELGTNGNNGYWRMFLAKYDTSGQQQWVRAPLYSDNDLPTCITTDKDGNIFFAGKTTASLNGPHTTSDPDLFVAKYDRAGNELWVRQLGSVGYDEAFGVTTDAAGNVYLTGVASSDFDGNTNAGNDDLIVVKYDAAGQKQWSRELGSSALDDGYRIASDNAGNVYVAGFTELGSFDGHANAGSVDALLVKYDASGQKLWSRQLGSSGADYAFATAIDASGYVYVAGSTEGTIDGQSSAGGSDGFLVKYNAAGDRQWTRMHGSSAGDTVRGIAIDNQNAIYLTGETSGGIDGHINAGTDTDIYIVKYDDQGNRL